MSKANIYMTPCTARINKKQLAWITEQITDSSNPLEDYADVIVEVDVYDVIDAFKVQPSLVNAVKKCMKPGGRHAKSKIQDLEEAIGCIRRVIEIETIKENLSNLV